jgi:MerR family transcriptional regulator/heat shock protein HspR
MADEASYRIDLGFTVEETTPVFVISVAAQLAGMHPQTLRQYDRLGLVSPGRTAGRGRRYSPRDVARLREVQRLSQDEGVNLAGIKRVLELEAENDALRDELEVVRSRLSAARRVFAAGPAGDIVAVAPGRRPERMGPASSALVVWRPQARR